MRGIVAKRLRKQAAKLCNKEEGNYVVKQFTKFFKRKGKELTKETIEWRPNSFMAVYRNLKKAYKCQD